MDSSSHVISLLLANTLIKQLANLEILKYWKNGVLTSSWSDGCNATLPR